MKKSIALAMAILIVLGLAACSKSLPEVPATTEAKPETTAAPTAAATEAPVATTEAPVVTTEAPVTEAPTTEAPTTQAPTTEAPATEAPVETGAAPSGTGSELLKDYDWTDGVIAIDGVVYQSFYDPYSKFVENGWDFEFDGSGIKETDLLNARTYVIGGVYLYNEAYPGSSAYNRPDIYISFYNGTDENLPYKECNVLGIEVDGCSAFDTWEKSTSPCECYDFEIPRGIRRGDSMETVKAAYGEPSDVYVAEGHYEILTYKDDEKKMELKLKVSYDDGLQGVEINDSRQWLR